MSEITELLDVGSVSLSLRAKRKKEAIAELVALLKSAGKIDREETIVKAIMDREQLSSTGIGNGIAIPHRLLEEIPRTVMAFGRSERGINFDAIDNRPVTLIFLILGPAGHSGEHLKLLSRLSRFLHDEKFTGKLRAAVDAGDVLRLFREQESNG